MAFAGAALLAAFALSSYGNAPRSKLRLDLFDRNAVLIFVKRRQPLSHRRHKLQLLYYLVNRHVLRQTAQQIHDELLIIHVSSLRVRFSSCKFTGGSIAAVMVLLKQMRSRSPCVPKANYLDGAVLVIHSIDEA